MLTPTEKWKLGLKAAGKQMAMVQTDRAIWDICGIESDNGTFMVLSYMSVNGRSKKYVRKQEKIHKSDIEKIRYYTEN